MYNDFEKENDNFNSQSDFSGGDVEKVEKEYVDFAESSIAAEQEVKLVNSYSWNDDVVEPAKYKDGEEKKGKKEKGGKVKFLMKMIAVTCAMAICLGVGYIARDYIGENDDMIYSTTGKSTKGVSTTESKRVISVSSTDNLSNSDEYSVVEIAEIAAHSVVEITTEIVTRGNVFGQFVSQGAGSGVVITPDGYIITNNHVIDGASNIKVKFKDDDQYYDADLVGTDAKTDIAVIKVEKTDLQPVVFGDSGKLKVGESVVAIGNPLGSLGGTVTNGIISALDREIEIDGSSMYLLQTNAAINPGNSGGGLFNNVGQLIGVVNAKSSGSDIEGLGFAIPSNIAKEVAEDLMNYGYVRGRVDLGMTLIDILTAQMVRQYRVQQPGVYIYKVESGGSANTAGLQSGDCILEVNGTKVADSSEFTKAVDSYKIGDTINIMVYRNGQEVTCSITLQEYKP